MISRAIGLNRNQRQDNRWHERSIDRWLWWPWWSTASLQRTSTAAPVCFYRPSCRSSSPIQPAARTDRRYLLPDCASSCCKHQTAGNASRKPGRGRPPARIVSTYYCRLIFRRMDSGKRQLEGATILCWLSAKRFFLRQWLYLTLENTFNLAQLTAGLEWYCFGSVFVTVLGWYRRETFGLDRQWYLRSYATKLWAKMGGKNTSCC